MNNQPTFLEPTLAYKYCPKCASIFEHKGGNWLKCTQCRYNFFVNAAPAAGVFILNDKNEVLLAKRKFDPKKGTWQAPGGFMYPGETFEEALHREITEELGVKVKLIEYAGSMPETYNYGGVSLPFLGLFYTAKIVEGEISPKDDVEEAKFFGAGKLDGVDITYPGLLPLIKEVLGSAS